MAVFLGILITLIFVLTSPQSVHALAWQGPPTGIFCVGNTDLAWGTVAPTGEHFYAVGKWFEEIGGFPNCDIGQISAPGQSVVHKIKKSDGSRDITTSTGAPGGPLGHSEGRGITYANGFLWAVGYEYGPDGIRKAYIWKLDPVTLAPVQWGVSGSDGKVLITESGKDLFFSRVMTFNGKLYAAGFSRPTSGNPLGNTDWYVAAVDMATGVKTHSVHAFTDAAGGEEDYDCNDEVNDIYVDYSGLNGSAGVYVAGQVNVDTNPSDPICTYPDGSPRFPIGVVVKLGEHQIYPIFELKQSWLVPDALGSDTWTIYGIPNNGVPDKYAVASRAHNPSTNKSDWRIDIIKSCSPLNLCTEDFEYSGNTKDSLPRSLDLRVGINGAPTKIVVGGLKKESDGSAAWNWHLEGWTWNGTTLVKQWAESSYTSPTGISEVAHDVAIDPNSSDFFAVGCKNGLGSGPFLGCNVALDSTAADWDTVWHRRSIDP